MQSGRPVLVLLEGSHDARFLKVLSSLLHSRDPTLPDLALEEQAGNLVIVPTGGGDARAWARRFAPLGRCEFHLYDREKSHEAVLRQAAIDLVNRRPNCHGFLTRQRSIEHYLHPAAIKIALGVDVGLHDDVDVIEAVARALLGRSTSWEGLTRQRRRRLRDGVKFCLNTRAVAAMTCEWLAESDPHGDATLWMRTIGRLLHDANHA